MFIPKKLLIILIIMVGFSISSPGDAAEDIRLLVSNVAKPVFFNLRKTNFYRPKAFETFPSQNLRLLSCKLNTTAPYSIKKPSTKFVGLMFISTCPESTSKNSLLDEILLREETHAAFGFKRKSHRDVITNISNICTSISEVTELPDQRQVLQERVGELLLTSFSFCILYDFCPKETTQKTLIKFKKRLNGMKEIVRSDGYLDLNDHSPEVMLAYWKKAKKIDASLIERDEKLEADIDLLEEFVLLENQARAFGFKWSNHGQLIQKVQDECQEIAEAIEKSHRAERVQEELGDLVLATLSFCMHCDFHPKETIQKLLRLKTLHRL